MILFSPKNKVCSESFAATLLKLSIIQNVTNKPTVTSWKCLICSLSIIGQLAVKPVLRTGNFNVIQLYLRLRHKYCQLNKLSQLIAINCDSNI